MDSTHNVHPVTRKTRREAAEVLGRAFADEPVSLAIYKGLSKEKRIKNLTADFDAEMAACVRRGAPLQVSDGGKVVAAAAIFPPGTYPLPWIEEAIILVKSVLGHDRYDVRVWLEWLKATEKYHAQEPHYYFEYLGVLPEYQGKGYGSAIMKHLNAIADRANMPCYLETASPTAVPLYQRLGYEILAEEEIIGVRAWFMWRKAQTPPQPSP